MKKNSKIQSIIVAIIVALVVLVGCFFAFVPFEVGTKDYSSFLKNVRVSGDLKEGMYAEYTISSASTDEEIASSIEKMRTILADKGFVNANVSKKGKDVLRVEVKGASSSYDNSSIEETLKAFTGGLFEIKDAKDDTAVNVIDASKHLKSVSIGSSGASYFVLIKLNKAGTEVYKALTQEVAGSSTGVAYMFLNGEAWPNSTYNYYQIPGVVGTGEISLSVGENLAYAELFALNIMCGSLDVELDASTVEIAHITPILSNGAYLILNILLVAVLLGVLVLFAIKFRMLTIPFAVAMLINAVVALFFFQAMPWVELDMSSFVAIIVCFGFISINTYIIYKKAQTEYAIGKQLLPSFEVCFRSGIKPVCDMSIPVGLFGLVSAILGNVQIQTLGTILVMYAIMNLLTNCLLLNWFTKLIQNIFNLTPKFYGMKREGHINEIG